jgi:hypothetical protein
MENEQKNFVFRIWKSMKNFLQKSPQEERKLKLLFKACALVIYADKKFSPEEVIGLQAIFEEAKICQEDRKYFTSCINKAITADEIRKELNEYNHTREELEEIIELCSTLGRIDKLSNEEKLVIRKLKNMFGLEKD